MSTPQFQVITGDCIEVMRGLPAGSVDCCVTSPPYWGLRDYGTAKWEGGAPNCDHRQEAIRIRRNLAEAANACDGGNRKAEDRVDNDALGLPFRDVCGKCGARRVDQQIGLEETPEAYTERMVEVFREVWRVLADNGSLWLNLGDSYARDGGSGGCGPNAQVGNTQSGEQRRNCTAPIGLKPKDLCGIPWRLAFALQADGWYLRSDIIWCLSGGTYLYAKTQKGIQVCMARDLARLDPATVQLWNGEKWTQLLGMNRSHRRGTELELTLRSGERISCTPTHKWPTQRGLLEASDLVVGDVLQATELPEPERCRDCAVDEDAAWFAGLYIAEGSRSGRTIQIAGHANETARWERLQRIAAKYGGQITRSIIGNNMSIRMYGKVLFALLDELVSGRTAKDKGFSPSVWQYSNSFIAAMLDGYLSGDGHFDEQNNRWRLGFTRNYNLERDLRAACARLGYALTLKMCETTFDGRRWPIFRGELRKDRSGHHNERDCGEIISIGKAKCREVYDLGVADEPHLFALASGVLSHNSKPNPMPESVTDRPTKAHEYIFLLTKSARYYYDAVAVAEESIHAGAFVKTNGNEGMDDGYDGHRTRDGLRRGVTVAPTRNRRTVWTVTTEPFPEAHFATYPTALVEPCIRAGCPQQVCAECGKPWERVVERTTEPHPNRYSKQPDAKQFNVGAGDYVDAGGLGMAHLVHTTGFSPTCACNAATRPGTVLDPFTGSGTTGLVAMREGRNFIGCELNPEYAEMARRRIAGWRHKPIRQRGQDAPEGQETLFAEEVPA